MLSLGRCDAQICLNVGFALAACEKPLCARGVHEPDIPSAGAQSNQCKDYGAPLPREQATQVRNRDTMVF